MRACASVRCADAPRQAPRLPQSRSACPPCRKSPRRAPLRSVPAPGRRLRQDAGAPKAARGYAGKRLRTASAPQPSDAQSAPGEAVYAIPKWMMTVLCVILGAAVLGGALLAFSRLGWSPLYRETTLTRPRRLPSLHAGAGAGDCPAAAEPGTAGREPLHERGGPEARPDARTRAE